MTTPESRSEAKQQHQETDDPVLLMPRVGKQLWERESGDRFIERLRSEDLPPFEGQPDAPASEPTSAAADSLRSG